MGSTETPSNLLRQMLMELQQHGEQQMYEEAREKERESIAYVRRGEGAKHPPDLSMGTLSWTPDLKRRWISTTRCFL